MHLFESEPVTKKLLLAQKNGWKYGTCEYVYNVLGVPLTLHASKQFEFGIT